MEGAPLGLSFVRHTLLDGKVTLHHALNGGHRAGLDAVMLAASVVSDNDTEALHVIDLGSGAGGAGFSVASRLANARVTLVDNDERLLALARSALDDPANDAFSDRVTLSQADVTLRGAARQCAGLVDGSADRVIMNPPFREKTKARMPMDEGKASAYILGDEGIAPWFRTAAGVLKPAGVLSVIFPPEGLDQLLVEMRGRFGAITLFPLFKSAGEPATRLILTGVKGSRTPLKVSPGLVLHERMSERSGRRNWTSAANRVLNGEVGLII